jgi:hypothetical protein
VFASHSKLIGVGIVALGLGVLPTACSTTRPPTVPEIQDALDREERRIRELVKEWLRICETLPDTPGIALSPRQQCINNANAFLNDALNKLEEVRRKAILKAWEDAQKAREAYEKWLRDQIDQINIPGIIKDLIKPLLPQASITTDLNGSILGITTENGQDDGRLKLSGAFTIADTTLGFSETGTMSLSFQIAGTLQGTTPNGKVYAGSTDFTTASGASWTAIVETDEGNWFETDTSGNATVTVTMKATTSVKGWNSVLPAYPRIQLKLQRQANGSFRVHGVNQSSSAFFGRDPYAITDFNNDGARVYASDYAAFTAGLADYDPRADVNEDGSWDSLDTDLWLRLFQEDTP